MPASNATSRFSDRVENYVRYRPGYPSEVVETLKAECGLKPEHVIADIASGTGIWTRLLLANGNRHWFDRRGARGEFVRIVKPEGWLVLLWNERRTDSTAFLRDYEQLLLTYGTDYKEVRHEQTTSVIQEFFDQARFEERVFPMRQEFDYAGLEGRLLSSSYAPGPNHLEHLPMLRELRRIFDKHQRSGGVTLEYGTRVYFGRLT